MKYIPLNPNLIRGGHIFLNMNLIPFSKYLYLPPESYIQWELKTKIKAAPQYKWNI